MRIAGAVAGFFFLAACSGHSSSGLPLESSPDSSTGFTLGQSPGDASAFGVAFGPDPPPTACEADAADPCPAPPWVCTDGGAIVVAYDLGQCVSGSCVWQKYDGNCAARGGWCTDPATFDAGVIDAGVDGPSAPDGSVWATVGACVLPVPAGPDPPETPCDADARTEGGVCPPPHSVCADSSWLVYYDDGLCVDGQCVWQKARTACPGGTGCFDGTCDYLGTSAVAPN